MKLQLCVLGVLVLGTAAGCGGEAAFDQVEMVDQLGSAAYETLADRTAAAAVEVGYGTGSEELWAFACDTNNRLIRAVKERDDVWSFEVMDTGCASTPSVGKQRYSDGFETVMVYYRSTGNRLWELVIYPHNGQRSFVNLSTASGVGKIDGRPLYVGVPLNGLEVVAVRQASTGYLYALHWNGSAWVATAAKKANGKNVPTTGTFGTGYPADSSPYMLTTQVSITDNMILTQQQVGLFVEKRTVRNVRGNLMISQFPINDGSPLRNCVPCLLSRDSSGVARAADVDENPLVWHTLFDERLGGSLQPLPLQSEIKYAARSASGELLYGDADGSPAVMDGVTVASAPAGVLDGFVYYTHVLFADEDHNLIAMDPTNDDYADSLHVDLIDW